MTVCIGAICADTEGTPGKSVVIASDRMVTMMGLTEFEHEVPKIKPINGTTVGLIAGDALRGATLARVIARCLPNGAVTIQNVADVAAQKYAELRLAQVQADVFTARGMTLNGFYAGGQQQLVPQLAGMMDQQVASYNFGVDFLIAGVDDEGGGLFQVANPGGNAADFASIGFTAIGSGTIHALQSLIGFGHTGERDLHETVFRVYASKRRAEVAPGVGKDTDIGIIGSSGVTYVAQEVLKELDKLYLEFQEPVVRDVRDKVAKLEIMKGQERRGNSGS